MGVERAVTRWYVLRQLILQKVAVLEAKLVQIGMQVGDNVPVEDKISTQVALSRAQEELHSLGPCPRPMMG